MEYFGNKNELEKTGLVYQYKNLETSIIKNNLIGMIFMGCRYKQY